MIETLASRQISIPLVIFLYSFCLFLMYYHKPATQIRFNFNYSSHSNGKNKWISWGPYAQVGSSDDASRLRCQSESRCPGRNERAFKIARCKNTDKQTKNRISFCNSLSIGLFHLGPSRMYQFLVLHRNLVKNRPTQ